MFHALAELARPVLHTELRPTSTGVTQESIPAMRTADSSLKQGAKHLNCQVYKTLRNAIQLYFSFLVHSFGKYEFYSEFLFPTETEGTIPLSAEPPAPNPTSPPRCPLWAAPTNTWAALQAAFLPSILLFVFRTCPGVCAPEFIHCKSISWWWWSLYPQTLSPALSQQLELQKPHHANPNSGSPLLTPSSYKLSQQIQLAAFKLLMILCTVKWDVYLTQRGLFNSKWDIMSTISHKLHLLYMLDTLHMYSDTVYEQGKIFCWNSFC